MATINSFPPRNVTKAPPPISTVKMNTGIPLVPLNAFKVCRGPPSRYKNIKQHIIHSALFKPNCDRDIAEQLRLVQHWVCFMYGLQDGTIVTPNIDCMSCVSQISSMSTGLSLTCGRDIKWVSITQNAFWKQISTAYWSFTHNNRTELSPWKDFLQLINTHIHTL
jgi:hypothetical protein